MTGTEVPARAPAPTAAGGARGVIEALRATLQAGQPCALALVVAAAGSTYRKPGAIAAVDAQGRRTGTLSGGCLEPEIERLAAAALAAGEPREAVLDTRADEDRLFGSGSGCRGSMRIVLLPLAPQRDAALVGAFAALLQGGAPLRLAVLLDGAQRGAWLVERGQAEVARRPELAPQALAALQRAQAHAPGAVVVAVDGAPAHAAVVQVAPIPRLLLVGAGPEAPLLTRLARGLGWHVAVIDHRAGLLDPQRLPDADVLHHARPAAGLAALAAPRADAVVVMTHGASSDAEALAALAAAPMALPYVALLGPPARRDELLAELDAAAREALLPHLHAPAGLALGGEGPEAIALSIAAQLQQHFARRA